MAGSQGLFLDLALVATTGGYRLLALTANGMLWLQTHFDDKHWAQLASGHVSVEEASAALIRQDAQAAGLGVSRLGIHGQIDGVPIR